jgi:hypothetical protein
MSLDAISAGLKIKHHSPTSKERKDEIAGSERACHDGRNPLAIRRLYPDLISNMHEHLVMAQRHQRQLAEVGVRGEVLEGMELCDGALQSVLLRKLRRRGVSDSIAMNCTRA